MSEILTDMGAQDKAQDVTAEDVLSYLKKHPKFLIQHPEAMDFFELPKAAKEKARRAIGSLLEVTERLRIIPLSKPRKRPRKPQKMHLKTSMTNTFAKPSSRELART